MNDLVQTVITWLGIASALFIVGGSLVILFQGVRTMVAARMVNLQTILFVLMSLVILPVAVSIYPAYMLEKATEGVNSVTMGMPAFVDGVLTLVDVAQVEAANRSAPDVPTVDPLPTPYVIMQPLPTPVVIPTAIPTLPPTAQPTTQPTPCTFTLQDGRVLQCPPTPSPNR